MHALLELVGYTGYQATCLTPVLWAIVFLAAVNALTGWLYDRAKRRACRRRHGRQREVYRHGRR